MRLLIVNYMSLPLPSVKGGAVEYLVDTFLLDNEKTHKHDITVYSIYDKEAARKASKYKYTNFNYIKIESVLDKADRIIRHLINRIPNVYIGNTYISKIVKKERNAEKYDAVILENAPEFALRFSHKFDGKLILHLHNDYLNEYSKKAKKIFDRLSCIYTISDTLGEYVKTIEVSEKVKTLYNGIDLERFKPDAKAREEVRKKYGIGSDDFVFMFSGRIVPEKGVLELLKAFRSFSNDRGNLKLVIAGGVGYSNFGENSYLRQLHDIADDNVIFTGFVDYSEMPKLYAAADVGVIPSLCNDAFNLSTIEFCANGVPVIVSDYGAMKELINENCGIVVNRGTNFVENLSSAMEYAANTEKRKQMGYEAKKLSEKFSKENYCDRFKKLLEEFAEK